MLIQLISVSKRGGIHKLIRVESEVQNVSLQWRHWRLKSPASRFFTQPFIQAQMKENIKALRHWPLCGEFTGDCPHKEPVTRKLFPFDDVIMQNI